MIEAKCDRAQHLTRVSGSCLDVCVDISLIIRGIHAALEQEDTEAAAEFRALITALANDPQSVFWTDPAEEVVVVGGIAPAIINLTNSGVTQ